MPRSFTNDDYQVSKFLNNVLMREVAFSLSRDNLFSTNIFVGLSAQSITIPPQTVLTEQQWQPGGSAYFISASAFAHTITPGVGVTVNGSTSALTFLATPYVTQLNLIRIDGDNWLAFSSTASGAPPSLGPVVWVSLPEASSVLVGTSAYVTDIGGGTTLVSNGSYWRPLSGNAVLRAQVSDVSTGVGTSEQIFTGEKITIPARFLQIGCVIRTYATFAKSGLSDSATLRTRLGSAGTIADASIFAAYTGLSSINLVAGMARAMRIASATTVLPLGSNTATVTSPMGISSAAVSAVTIPNISAGMVLSQTAQLSGSTDIVTIQGYVVEVIFP
jgi:hypothetical protein